MRRLLPLLLLASCTDSAVGFCEAKARAECARQLRCCTPDERVDASNAYTSSEAECFDRLASTCKAENAATDDSIALGRTLLKQANVDACLTALDAATEACDRTLAQAADLACTDVTDGLVAGGGACAFSSECRGGGVCDLGGTREVDEELHAPAGECLALPTGGDQCPEGVCAEGFFCDNNECDPLPGEGDACTTACADGLFCNDVLVCEARKVDGEPCIVPAECISAECLVTADASESLCGGDAATECDGP